MENTKLSLAFLAAALGAIAPAAAQGDKNDTINVLARKPEEVRREAQAFVRAMGVADRPVARFVDPVCPKALGVPREIAEKVEARFRTIAKDAGARVARGTCEANVTFAFDKNTDALVEEVARRSPGIFEEVGPGHVQALKRSPAPIRWWHTTAQRTKDGMRALGNDAPPAVAGRQDQPGGVPLAGQVYQQYRSSFLGTQMVRALTSATIVIDVDRANGLPLDSVAAFASLVGLAEIRFDEDAPANSILGLTDKDGPRDLTTLDQTFLRTLYKLPLDRTAIAHRGLLIRGLVSGEASKAER
jgi:hypothetical protein